MNNQVTKPIDADAMFEVMRSYFNASTGTVDVPAGIGVGQQVISAGIDGDGVTEFTPSITGKDIDKVLSISGDNTRLYLDLLHRFRKEYGDFPRKIVEVFSSEEDEAAKVSDIRCQV